MKQKLQFMPSFISELENINVRKEMHPANSVFEHHFHDYYEMEILLEGSMEHEYNNTRRIIKSGNIFLMTYYDFHQCTFLEDSTCITIQFNENFLNEELSNYINYGFNRYHACFEGEERERLFSNALMLLNESNNPLIFSNALTKYLLSEILISLIRKSEQNETAVTPTLIQQALTYIHFNYKENLSLNALAQHLSVSTNYLGNLLKKHLGISFNDYVNTVRLKYACNLLSATSISIKEVAYSSGYNSVEYFLHIFKKKFAMTPNKYRQQLNNQTI